MPRPKLDVSKRKTDAVHLRLTAEERLLFDRLAQTVGANELRGVAMTDAGLVRWLFLTAAAERGLRPDTKEVAGPPRAKRAKR